MTMTTKVRRIGCAGLLATLVLGVSVSFGQSPWQQIPLQVTRLNDAAGACVMPQVGPDSGNLNLKLPVPGSGTKPDHWIRWSAPHAFQMKFEGLAVHGKPKPPSDLGDEKDGVWVAAVSVPNSKDYEVKVKLKTGNGNETVISKYSVRIVGCAHDNDPVIIVGR
jgi:hypothetical protein